MNRKQLAVVHIAKKELGLDDDTYRELLKSAAGVESARELSFAGFERVMARFAECGWKAKGEGLGARGEDNAPAPSQAHNEEKQLWAKSKWRQFSKLDALLREQGLAWSYADGIAKRMFGVRLARWCNGEQLRGVTAALVYRGKKQGRETVRRGEREIGGHGEKHQ